MPGPGQLDIRSHSSEQRARGRRGPEGVQPGLALVEHDRVELAVRLEVADERAVGPVQLRPQPLGCHARGRPAGTRRVPCPGTESTLQLTDGAARLVQRPGGGVVPLPVDDSAQLGQQRGDFRVLGRADLADPPRDGSAALDRGEHAERGALDEGEVDVELDQPGPVHGAGGLQVDASELRLVCGELAQAGAQLPVGGPPPAVLDVEQRMDVAGVQPRRDRVRGTGRPGLASQLGGVLGASEPLFELGRQQGGRPGLGREPVRRELLREPQGRPDQPGRWTAAAQVGLEQHQLAGATPARVAVSAEPVPGLAGEHPRRVGVPAQQGDLRPRELDLADVLPGAVAAQLPRRGGEGLVSLVVQAGGEEHPGPVQQGDPDLGVLVHDDALVDDPERERQVAGEELQASEVVQGDPLTGPVARSRARATAASRSVRARSRRAHLDVQRAAVDQQPAPVDAGGRRAPPPRRTRRRRQRTGHPGTAAARAGCARSRGGRR